MQCWVFLKSRIKLFSVLADDVAVKAKKQFLAKRPFPTVLSSVLVLWFII